MNYIDELIISLFEIQKIRYSDRSINYLEICSLEEKFSRNIQENLFRLYSLPNQDSYYDKINNFEYNFENLLSRYLNENHDISLMEFRSTSLRKRSCFISIIKRNSKLNSLGI